MVSQAMVFKHMTQWMKTQFDANAGAAVSGFNAYAQINNQ